MRYKTFKSRASSITIGKKLFAGLAASALIIISISVLSVLGIQTLINENDWIEKSEHVENHLDHVYNYNMEIESSDQGFLLTGDNFYLELREKAVNELYQILKNLKLETAENQEQQMMLSRLKNYIDIRMAYSDKRIQARKIKGEKSTRSLFPLQEGKILIDNIHNLVLEMIARQDRNLRARKAAQRAQMTKNQSIIIIGFLSQILLLAYIFSMVRKDISGRQKVEKQLESQNKLLVAVNKQLEDSIEKEKQVEMLLQNALSKEKDLNELKSRFISTTSHEFRTPLTSILSSMQLVQKYRKKWSDEKLEDQFERVKNSIFNLTGMLDDILTISHTDSGVIMFKPQVIDLHRLCLDIINEISNGTALKYKFNFDFESIEKDFFLDPKLIRFIITNLLSNAFKYSVEGGCAALNVSSSLKSIEISVSNEGIGIPEEDRENLFKPFFRGSNTGDIEGTGLGLSIVKRAAELHNGSVKFISAAGNETKFLVIIPRSEE